MKESTASLITLIQSLASNRAEEKEKWMAKVKATSYLRQIEGLLKQAMAIVEFISQGKSVLLEEGPDPESSVVTAILTLSLLVLDPYFRTFEGFQALIQLHWYRRFSFFFPHFSG
jgi:hypothetical protein